MTSPHPPAHNSQFQEFWEGGGGTILGILRILQPCRRRRFRPSFHKRVEKRWLRNVARCCRLFKSDQPGTCKICKSKVKVSDSELKKQFPAPIRGERPSLPRVRSQLAKKTPFSASTAQVFGSHRQRPDELTFAKFEAERGEHAGLQSVRD